MMVSRSGQPGHRQKYVDTYRSIRRDVDVLDHAEVRDGPVDLRIVHGGEGPRHLLGGREDAVEDVMLSCYGAPAARETAAARAGPRVEGVTRTRSLELNCM